MTPSTTTSTVLLKHHLKALKLPTVATECEIRLFSGNEPSWLIPFVPELLAFVRGARKDAGLQAAPDTIDVT